jgi:membrane protein YdbS with pleckstrin-like domain
VASQKQLGPDEHVVLALRQHVKALFVPILIFLVLCAAVGFGAALIPEGDAQTWIRLVIVLVGLIIAAKWVLWPFLNWLTSRYTVTNERILTQHGVIRRYGRTMPLSRVNDVSFDHGLVDRMLGCGTLVVSSAGEQGQLLLHDVPRVETVQREIYGLVEAEHDRARSGVIRPLDTDDGTGYGPNV